MAGYVKVAEVDELRSGDKMLIELDGQFVALFNIGGDYYALGDVCTHDGGPLADGDLEGHEIVCPRHGARFDVRTGEAFSMPAFEPVPTYSVRIDGNDILIAPGE